MQDQLTVLRHESANSQQPTVLVDQNDAVDGDELKNVLMNGERRSRWCDQKIKERKIYHSYLSLYPC